MRGSHTLFNNIFETNTVVKQGKGRSASLIASRNECLINRYYYYGKFFNYKYSYILKQLEDEFFISIVTIPEVISINYELLTNLKKQQPSLQSLKKKWPHLVWSAMA